MSATQTPLASQAPSRASGKWLPHPGLKSFGREYPFITATVVSVALAALSAAVLPTVPSYDPWSWITWGREVVDPHLSFVMSGGPSWKPLPWFFTIVWALFGSSAAPTLWVITARAGGLLALFAAYRLAARLVGSPRWAAVAAGVLAAAGVVVTQEWFYYMYRGTSEPMLIACALWAIDRHLERKYAWAFVLGIALGLIRPEAWPFLIVYGAWLWWRHGSTRMRVLVVLGLFSLPFFWFVPPWIGSGQPLLAASHAKDYNGHLGSNPFLTVLGRGLDIQTIPVLVLGAVAVLLAWFRRPREWLTVWLGAGAAAWWVVVVGMTLDGYPGLERFYLPAAGVTAVLAGVGIVRLAELAARGRTVVAAGVILGLAALTIPFTGGRLNEASSQEKIASRAVTRLDQLSSAVAAVGGHDRVFPCGTSYAAVNHSIQTALAYKLHVTLERVGTRMIHQGVLFVGPHDSIDGGLAPIKSDLTQRRLLAQVGAWKVYRVTKPGMDQRCVGS